MNLKRIKSIFKARYFIATLAILIIVGRAIWPNIKFDDTSFHLILLIAVVLLIPDIGDLISRIKRFKKGDLEIELESKINELAGRTEKAEEDIKASKEDFEYERFSDNFVNRITEYTRDPRGGLIAIAVEIESKLDEIARHYQINKQTKYSSPIRIVDEFTKIGIVPKELPSLIRDFWTIRNKAVHSVEYKLTNEHLYRLLDLGIRILDLLSLKKHKDNGLTNHST